MVHREDRCEKRDGLKGRWSPTHRKGRKDGRGGGKGAEHELRHVEEGRQALSHDEARGEEHGGPGGGVAERGRRQRDNGERHWCVGGIGEVTFGGAGNGKWEMGVRHYSLTHVALRHGDAHATASRMPRPPRSPMTPAYVRKAPAPAVPTVPANSVYCVGRVREAQRDKKRWRRRTLQRASEQRHAARYEGTGTNTRIRWSRTRGLSTRIFARTLLPTCGFRAQFRLGSIYV